MLELKLLSGEWIYEGHSSIVVCVKEASDEGEWFDINNTSAVSHFLRPFGILVCWVMSWYTDLVSFWLIYWLIRSEAALVTIAINWPQYKNSSFVWVGN